MRFQGNITENLIAAARSKDSVLLRELVIDKIANIIQTSPKEMVKILRYSKVDISDTATMKELVNAASYNLHNNLLFQKNLAVTIEKGSSAQAEEYAQADDGGGGSTAGGVVINSGGGGGSMVSSIADMIASIGKYGASSNDLKAEQEKSKSLMYQKIFGDGEEKTNWMPIIVIAGVLLIGAMVVWRVTATKK